MWGTLVNHCWREIERIKYDWPNHSMWILWDIPSGHVWNIREDQWIYPTRVDTPIYLNMDEHGTLNVPIEHHPTIWYMVYNGYYKVMSNISKMGQLPTPDEYGTWGLNTCFGLNGSRFHFFLKLPDFVRLSLRQRIRKGRTNRPFRWWKFLFVFGIHFKVW